MGTLFLKEINSFIHSLTGYIVVIIFLAAISLFLWVFPGTYNILEAGYANIDPLFVLAPWVFMFLAPAITMKMFAEETRTGTIEMLLTKPVSEWQIILSKYLAGVSLLLMSLIPTLFYFYTVSNLGAPPSNIDTGAMWGSYIGLLFLGSGFIAIGVFASSLSSNQIIAFILAVFISFIAYVGFESLSSLEIFGLADHFILSLGINEHYISLSRGVIDTRDVLYFLGLIFLFLLLTKTKLESRKW
ncbi:MAG: gliding motility-associated ABC transporter permease subunit GldF [Flavobacteriales bacterium]|nr:gliding motility-associated ABC transporter permease subunit GldF [Flavobacteriales bacterium]